MVKKVRTKKDDGKFATIKDSAQNIWHAGLGAITKAQHEGNKVFEALMRESDEIQEKTRKVTESKMAEVAARATGTWGRLEQVFEDRVAVALHSLGVPTQRDVDLLSRRVKELTAQVEKLQSPGSRSRTEKS